MRQRDARKVEALTDPPFHKAHPYALQSVRATQKEKTYA